MSDNQTSTNSRIIPGPSTHSTYKPQTVPARMASKSQLNDEYKAKYPPFNVSQSNYHVVFLNKGTSFETMQFLIDHVQDCRGFTFDTESNKANYQLALIQIQTVPRKLPIYVMLVELAHLPPSGSRLHSTFQQLFQLLFKPDNILFTWGQLDKEIHPALRYNLFTWPILSTMVNVQYEFRHWYNWALSHCEACSPQTTCTCHEPDPYLPHEHWSLQKALIYTSGLFLDKSMTLENWTAGLESSQSALSKSKQKKLIYYAIHDCFATSYFIHPLTQQWTFKELSNVNFIDLFQAPSTISTSKLLLSSTSFKTSSSKSSSRKIKDNIIVKDINPQTFKHVMDNDLELISDDSEEEILLAQCIIPSNTQELYEDISDDDIVINKCTQQIKAEILDSIPENELPIIDQLAQNEHNESVNNHNLVDDDTINHHVVNENLNVNHILPRSTNTNQRRSAEARRRRNKKRNNMFRARRYRYFISRPIYYRFTMKLVKFILHENKIFYTHVKIENDLLIIGVKTNDIQRQIEEQLSRSFFDRNHYHQVKRKYYQQSQ